MRRAVRFFLHPWLFAPVAAAVYLAVSFSVLRTTVNTPSGRADLVSGDAGHYLEIADTFAKGDFSMSYVKARPHRQPLYPAVIAPVMYFAKGHDLFAMAAVNILFATLGFLLLYFAVLRLYGDIWIAAVVGLLYLVNPFLLAQTTRHLMTEPLHILLMIGIIYSYLAYQKTNRFGFAAAAVAITGLDYLSRPNGLFIFASLLGTLTLGDLHQLWITGRWTSPLAFLKRGPFYAALVAIFILMTVPSWLPRLHDFGNPIYHGYLSNYMWVDSYKEGHVGQAEVKYTWHDYARTHTAWDAMKRGSWGVWRVLFAIPWTIEQHFPLLILLATLGVAVCLAAGPAEYRLLLIFALVQLVPLMWTTLSNPNVRVPYASTFPFELAFAGYLLQYGRPLLTPLLVEFNRRRRHVGPTLASARS